MKKSKLILTALCGIVILTTCIAFAACAMTVSDIENKYTDEGFSLVTFNANDYATYSLDQTTVEYACYAVKTIDNQTARGVIVKFKSADSANTYESLLEGYTHKYKKDNTVWVFGSEAVVSVLMTE